MSKRIVWLSLLLLAACRPADNNVCADCGGGGVTEATVTPTVPAKVTGVRATRITTGVRLVWKTAVGAKGYEIYRQETIIPGAPLLSASLHTLRRTPFTRAARVPGVRIGSAASTGFIDTSVTDGYEYTYRVVAFNNQGDAPASEPASIQVLPSGLSSWVNDWLQAPGNANTGGGGNGPLDWSASVGTAGGNAGDGTTTQFPDTAAEFAGCAQAGAGVTQVRPSIDTLIPEAPQTFSLDLTYNTGGASGWSYTLMALGYGDDFTPIYMTTGSLSGCGKKTLTFTVDATLVPQDEILVVVQVNDQYDDSIYFDLLSYRSVNGEWVRVVSTNPARDTLLAGGTLEVGLEYRNAAAQTIRASLVPLSGWGMSFGQATTVVAGTGTVTLSLPYRTVCGFTTGVLNINAAADVVSSSYSYPVTSYESYQLLAVSDGWIKRGYRYFTSDVWALKCGGKESVTLTAPLGWRAGLWDPDIYATEWNQSISGLSGMDFDIQADDDFLAALPYGTSVSYMTATFAGATITAPVAVNVYGLFWQLSPPATAVGNTNYPVSITVAGPRPADTISVTVSWRDRPLMWNENTQAYAGQISYPTCAIFSNNVSDSRRYYRAQLDGTHSTYVTSSDSYEVKHYGTIYFDAGYGDIGPAEEYFYEACDKSFHWQVVGAPSWVRFESLSGDDSTPMRLGLLTSEAFVNDYYAYGVIDVEIAESQQVLHIEVDAWQ